MRTKRIRDDELDTVYCIENSFLSDSGLSCDDPRCARKFNALVRCLQKLYVIEFLSVAVNSTGYKILCLAPAGLPSLPTVRENFLARYGSRELPDFDQYQVYLHWAWRMRDISALVKDLEQLFTTWYNHEFMDGQRRGTVWVDRFKSAIVRSVKSAISHVGSLASGMNGGKIRQSIRHSWRKLAGKHPFLEDLPEVVEELKWALPRLLTTRLFYCGGTVSGNGYVPDPCRHRSPP
jgi:hypothetical protein